MISKCVELEPGNSTYLDTYAWVMFKMKRYYETPILYRNLGIEMFCNFVDESIKESPILEPPVVDKCLKALSQ